MILNFRSDQDLASFHTHARMDELPELNGFPMLFDLNDDQQLNTDFDDFGGKIDDFDKRSDLEQTNNSLDSAYSSPEKQDKKSISARRGVKLVNLNLRSDQKSNNKFDNKSGHKFEIQPDQKPITYENKPAARSSRSSVSWDLYTPSKQQFMTSFFSDIFDDFYKSGDKDGKKFNRPVSTWDFAEIEFWANWLTENMSVTIPRRSLPSNGKDLAFLSRLENTDEIKHALEIDDCSAEIVKAHLQFLKYNSKTASPNSNFDKLSFCQKSSLSQTSSFEEISGKYTSSTAYETTGDSRADSGFSTGTSCISINTINIQNTIVNDNTQKFSPQHDKNSLAIRPKLNKSSSMNQSPYNSEKVSKPKGKPDNGTGQIQLWQFLLNLQLQKVELVKSHKMLVKI